MKKYLLSLLLVFTLCAALLLPVSASQEGYVFDLTGIFDGVESMNDEAEIIRQVTGIAPYFIITDDQGGLSCEQYVQQFAGEHGFYKDAVVLLSGEGSDYITAFGAAIGSISADALSAMREAYSESETPSGGVRDYFNLLFTTIETPLPESETQATAQTQAMAETPDETFVPLASDEAQAPAHSARLVDHGALLDAQEETRLAALLDQVSEKHGADVVIVTESTLGGVSARTFADDYYDYNGYAEDGILLLYCPNEGARYISTSGKAIGWFEDDNFTELTDEIIPYFDSGDYVRAFTVYAETCDRMIADETAFPWFLAVLSVVLGLALSALIPMNVLKGELKSVRAKASASDYVRSGSMNLTQDKDIFLYHTVTRTARPKNNSGGTHTGSSGRSHGGGSF